MGGRFRLQAEGIPKTMQPAKWLLPVACWLLSGPAPAWQETHRPTKRLYVESFATREGAQKLRHDLTAEIRKLGTFSLVSNEANADLILGGGGELWVKGYRSFSPRSHMKMPSNGTPIYGGYLSVELKNSQGVTVWSYLAAPGAASEDVSHDISERIAKRLAEAPVESAAPPTSTARQPPIKLSGAGATFPYPVYQKWFTNFQIENPGTTII